MSLSSSITSLIDLNVPVSAACTYAINQGNSNGSICRLAPTVAQSNKCYCTASEVNSVQAYCADDTTAWRYVDFMQRIASECAAANLPVPSGGTIIPLPSSVTSVAATATAAATSGIDSATSEMPSVVASTKTGMASATSGMSTATSGIMTTDTAATSITTRTAATATAIPTKLVPASTNLLGGAFRGTVGFGMVAVAILLMF
ncbi:hypothetical protein HDU98_000014 [Podochytrium sp. JEL0797]|nr:hypothetical protein HDU98_000014 [Podochytrium sp. JEL0797]